MGIGTIITWLLRILGLFKGRSSSRVKLEIRSEKAIADDKEKLDKLHARMMGLDSEIKDTIYRLVAAKKKGNAVLEGRMGDKRDVLFRQFQEAKHKYDELNNNL